MDFLNPCFQFFKRLECVLDIVAQNQSKVLVAKLSQHQKLMLMIAAVKGFSQPTSKDVIQQMRASVGSAAKTFKFLLQQDYIYLGTDGFYKIVDPAVEAFLKRTAVTVIG